MTFPRVVNQYQSPGVEGSRASANPTVNYVTGPGGLVTGANGATVARFAWATPQADGSERIDSNALLVAAGLNRADSLGFVSNQQQGLNTVFLAESGMTILPWQIVEMFERGDFWCKMLAAAARNQKVFANMLDGSAMPGTAGTPITTASLTASFATNVMTVTVNSAVLKIGQAITGTGVPANTYIASFGTMTSAPNATGTVNLTTSPGTVGSAAGIIASDYVETRFKVLSVAAINEIAKIGFGD